METSSSQPLNTHTTLQISHLRASSSGTNGPQGMPSTPAHTLRASQHLSGHFPELGPCAPPRAQVTRPRLPSGEMPSSACTAGLGVGLSSWILDEFRTRTQMGKKRESPQVKEPACPAHTLPCKGRQRDPGAPGGGDCCLRRPFTLAPLTPLGKQLESAPANQRAAQRSH